MAIWNVRMERDLTMVGHVTVEAESAQAAELAAFEFLENGEGNDDVHWISKYGECDLSSDPADKWEQPEIRATDTEGNYEMVNEDER
jgi:hypothetical protein